MQDAEEFRVVSKEHAENIDKIIAERDDLREELYFTIEERDHAKRNSSAFEERVGQLQVENGNLKQRILELTTDRDTLREALNALRPQPKVLKECVQGYGHGGFWCGPSYKCWLDPRPKDERD